VFIDENLKGVCMSAIIILNSLSKHFKVPVRESGLKASIASLIKRKYSIVKAVDDINFHIDQGEVVGFLGPNGAGKTTTLKMLSGLLYPTTGQARVLGFEPSQRQPEFLRQITLVMGNRQQLVWDLPALDSFDLMRSIYSLPTADFNRTRDEFIELLELNDLVNKPIRNLSLGERMKMEIAGALLHRPKVLFLDEPTLGLDVTMQRRIRAFVLEYNRRHGATVLLTSHYMADVEALCRRVIVIHHGKLLFDGELSGLVEQFSAFKTVGVTLQTASADLRKYGQVVNQDGTRFTLRVPKSETAQVTAHLLADLPVDDLNVEDPPIEDVIEQVFADGKSVEITA
jgi:ABC-2 type transport system ATP-binding protein